MKVLLIGGTGFIGQSLASNLISSGHQVWILSRHPERAHVPEKAGIEKWDGRTAAGWEKLAAEAQAIINLAGESIGEKRWTREQKERIQASRSQVGNAVVEAIKNTAAMSGSGPSILVQASAIGYYGPSGEQELSENAAPGSDYLAGVCMAWESSTKAVEDLGVRRVIIRTGLVLSLTGGVLPRILMPFKVFAGGPMGSGRQWYSWIHLHDEVEAIRFLVENESAQGVYNLTAPQPVINADFGRTIAKVFKRPYWLAAPSFMLRLGLGEMSSLVLDGQKVIPEKLLKSGFQFKWANLDDALRNLRV